MSVEFYIKCRLTIVRTPTFCGILVPIPWQRCDCASKILSRMRQHMWLHAEELLICLHKRSNETGTTLNAIWSQSYYSFFLVTVCYVAKWVFCTLRRWLATLATQIACVIAFPDDDIIHYDVMVVAAHFLSVCLERKAWPKGAHVEANPVSPFFFCHVFIECHSCNCLILV